MIKFLLLLSFAWVTSSLAQTEAVTGVVTVVEVQGKAQVRFSGEPDWHPITREQRLSPGSTVRTQAHTRLALLLADRTQVRVNENSLLEIQEVSGGGRTAGQTKFRQMLGRSWVQSKSVAKNVQWVTPVATAGIRGTDWEIEVAEDGRTLLTVLSGEIDFSNEQGRLLVRANEQAVVVRGQAPVKLLVQNPRQRVQWVSAYQADPLRHIALDGRRIPDLLATVADTAAADSDTLLRRGRALADLGRWPEAQAAFTQVLAVSPGDVHARIGLAFAALQRGSLDPARDLLGAIEQEGTAAESAAYAQVALKILAQDLSGALVDLHGMLARGDSTQPAPWLLLADLLAYEGQYQPGLDILAQGLQRFPGNARLLSQQARLHWLVDEPELAMVSAETATRSDISSYEAQLTLGDIARREGNAAITEAAYGRAIALKPADDRAWFGRGVAASEREYVRAARSDLGHALDLNPDGIGYQGERGTLETFANDFSEAEAAFQAALQTNSADVVALTGQGLLRLKQGQPKAALDAFLRAGVMEPRYARAHVYSAVAYYQLGQERQAQESLARASQLDPLDPLPHLLSGVIHGDRLRPAAAIAASREALRLMPYLKSLNQVANDQKGSANLGQAFALFGMEEWASSYAQESFNPFWAGSHLFLADRYSGLYSKNSELFQGLLADPTVFGAGNRFQSLIPAPVNNLSLSWRYSHSDTFHGPSPQVEWSGYQVKPLPMAYYLGYEDIHFSYDDGPFDLGIATAALGAKPSHDSGVFLFLDRSRQTDDAVTGVYNGDAYDVQDELVSRRGDLGYHYSLSPHSQFWFKAGVFSSDETSSGLLIGNPLHAGTQVEQPEYAFRHSWQIADRHQLSWGAEYGLRKTLSNLTTTFSFLPDLSESRDARLREYALDLYLSDHYKFSPDLTLQADVYYQRQRRTGEEIVTNIFFGGVTPASDFSERQTHSQLSPRLGLIYRLAPQRLIRVAYQNWLRPVSFGSLGPVATAGIPLDDRMVRRGGELTRVRGQVEWELDTRTFLTGFLDFKRIDNHLPSLQLFSVGDLESLGKLRPRDLGSLMRGDLIESSEPPWFERGTIQSVGGAVNRLLTPNWSATGRYLLTHSNNTGRAAPGRDVPYLPRHTLAGGATWMIPQGWSLSSLLVYRSARFQDEANLVLLKAGMSGAVDLFRQSPDKHWLLRISADNLFDRNLDSQYTAELNYRF